MPTCKYMAGVLSIVGSTHPLVLGQVPRSHCVADRGTRPSTAVGSVHVLHMLSLPTLRSAVLQPGTRMQPHQIQFHGAPATNPLSRSTRKKSGTRRHPQQIQYQGISATKAMLGDTSNKSSTRAQPATNPAPGGMRSPF